MANETASRKLDRRLLVRYHLKVDRGQLIASCAGEGRAERSECAGRSPSLGVVLRCLNQQCSSVSQTMPTIQSSYPALSHPTVSYPPSARQKHSLAAQIFKSASALLAGPPTIPATPATRFCGPPAAACATRLLELQYRSPTRRPRTTQDRGDYP